MDRAGDTEQRLNRRLKTSTMHQNSNYKQLNSRSHAWGIKQSRMAQDGAELTIEIAGRWLTKEMCCMAARGIELTWH